MRNTATRRWAHWIGRNLARIHYARHIEPHWLEVNRLEIPIPDLPAAFDGLRIVQLSDLHVSQKICPLYVREAIELAQAEAPDLIALTGDFIHKGFHHIEAAAAVLKGMHAPAGLFAVLGNHDYSIRNALGMRRHPHLHRAVEAALQNVGVRVLRNEAVALEREGATLALLGVDDLWSRECDLEKAYRQAPSAGPRIVLAHNPRTVEWLGDRRCDLMLSGHTHGGQVDLPRLGRVVLGRKSRRFAAGLYLHNNTYLYVNKGVGFGWRVRFRVRPEVAVLTLRAPAERV